MRILNEEGERRPGALVDILRGLAAGNPSYDVLVLVDSGDPDEPDYLGQIVRVNAEQMFVVLCLAATHTTVVIDIAEIREVVIP